MCETVLGYARPFVYNMLSNGHTGNVIFFLMPVADIPHNISNIYIHYESFNNMSDVFDIIFSPQDRSIDCYAQQCDWYNIINYHLKNVIIRLVLTVVDTNTSKTTHTVIGSSRLL